MRRSPPWSRYNEMMNVEGCRTRSSQKKKKKGSDQKVGFDSLVTKVLMVFLRMV